MKVLQLLLLLYFNSLNHRQHLHSHFVNAAALSFFIFYIAVPVSSTMTLTSLSTAFRSCLWLLFQLSHPCYRHSSHEPPYRSSSFYYPHRDFYIVPLPYLSLWPPTHPTLTLFSLFTTLLPGLIFCPYRCSIATSSFSYWFSYVLSPPSLKKFYSFSTVPIIGRSFQHSNAILFLWVLPVVLHTTLDDFVHMKSTRDGQHYPCMETSTNEHQPWAVALHWTKCLARGNLSFWIYSQTPPTKHVTSNRADISMSANDYENITRWNVWTMSTWIVWWTDKV